MWTIKKILCPTDYSEASIAALDMAQDWAKLFEADLEVLHIIPQYPPEMIDFALPVPVSIPSEEERRADAGAVLHKFVQEHISPDLTVSEEVVLGAPAHEIVEVAKAREADVIIMGTHGVSGWNHFILGSVTESVLKTSACPVLTLGPKVPQHAAAPHKSLAGH